MRRTTHRRPSFSRKLDRAPRSAACRRFRSVSRYRVSLVREARYPYDSRHLHRPAAAAAFVGEILEDYDREVLGVLFLDVRQGVIGVHFASIGSATGSTAHPAEIFKAALAASAHSIVLFHNHPSGDPSPSYADLEFTHRMTEVGDALGLRVADHIIVGGAERWVSLRLRGALWRASDDPQREADGEDVEGEPTTTEQGT